ncbi:hypothetical protein [Flavobacterium sp. CAN_S2]|jgi:hypothetical protein|uniref:hypothetical protein n=1 Tax=Flavobacterium sp. CAN_S2 TaxID=2787726 RepID=UPI0018CB74F3
MKTEKEINQAILEITMKIRNEYPELNKYLSEMPVTIPDVDQPEMTIKVLSDYLESLENLLKKYSPSHK